MTVELPRIELVTSTCRLLVQRHTYCCTMPQKPLTVNTTEKSGCERGPSANIGTLALMCTEADACFLSELPVRKSTMDRQGNEIQMLS